MLKHPSITDCISSISAFEATATRVNGLSRALTDPSLGAVSLVRVAFAADIHTSGNSSLRTLIFNGLPACFLKTALNTAGICIFYGNISVSRFVNVLNNNSTVNANYANSAGNIIRAASWTGQVPVDNSQVNNIHSVIATNLEWSNLAPPTANRNYSSFTLEGWLLLQQSLT